MDLVLYPRAAPSDRLRVWIGVFRQTSQPKLAWYLDGTPRDPAALREISSVRPDEMLPTHSQPQDVPRVFTGVYEFTGLESDTLYSITVQAGDDSRTLAVRTLPQAVPSALDQWFNVLLVSCFYQREDRGQRVGTIVSQLKAALKPHLTLLMGDQVYLDLPTQLIFPKDLARLAGKFEKDYTQNWQGPSGYGQVLAAAPSVSIPDDHEYWNNYPHPSPIVENSWNKNGRKTWRRAAQTMYEGFQAPYPARLGDPFILTVPPLSFFLADGRSLRDPDQRFILPEAAHQQLSQWVTQVTQQGWFGIFATGQSLFTNPAASVTGKVGDYLLPNYDDFPRLVTTLIRLVDAGQPLLCLTGDVHWGRVTEARDQITGRTMIYEVISSPSSLVTTIGLDQVKEVLFGRSNPWPRHADADRPPNFFARAVMGDRFYCPDPPLHRQRGDQVVLLSFRQHGGGIQVRIIYWPISLDSTIRKPQEVGPLYLKRI